MTAAHPETLKIVQTVHDTVVRVAEVQAADHWVGLMTGILSALATLVAAGVAVWGIRAWRHELKGATEYRLAIRVYRRVLRLRDKIEAARDGFNHFVPVYEGERDTNTPELIERERLEYWDWAREVLKATLALNALRPEAEMHWSVEGTKHIDAMDQLARKLRGNYRAYFHHRLRALRGEAEHAQAAEYCKKVIFNTKLTKEDRDEYGELLDAATEDARSFLRRKIDLTE